MTQQVQEENKEKQIPSSESWANVVMKKEEKAFGLASR